jgi:hypothetical protein
MMIVDMQEFNLFQVNIPYIPYTVDFIVEQ